MTHLLTYPHLCWAVCVKGFCTSGVSNIVLTFQCVTYIFTFLLPWPKLKASKPAQRFHSEWKDASFLILPYYTEFAVVLQPILVLLYCVTVVCAQQLVSHCWQLSFWKRGNWKKNCGLNDIVHYKTWKTVYRWLRITTPTGFLVTIQQTQFNWGSFQYTFRVWVVILLTFCAIFKTPAIIFLFIVLVERCELHFKLLHI